MLAKKQSKKTNLNFKIFFTSIFLIFIFSLSISSNTNAGRITPDDCSCAKNLTAGQTCQNSLGETCFGSNPKPANTCGNDIKEGSEECDFNSAFGPYPNQCANNGPCDQTTCKCSGGGGGTGTTPTPLAGTASFSADNYNISTGGTVNFTLTNGTGCINYLCEPGVGTQKYVYEKSFSCTYNTAGTYTASISCNGNKITKTITVTGTGTGTTPTPTPTPTISKPKPADYVTLHDAYTRAPEDNKVYDSNTGIWTGEYSQYYSFTQNVTTSHGLIEKFRAFIPPGTVLMGLFILNDGKHGAVARYKIPPSAEPIGYSTDYNTYYTIDQLIAGDCIVAQNNHTELPIAGDGFPTLLKTNRADWLYVKVGGGGAFNYHDTHFTVRVDIKTYNAWWDKYIKDEAGWNKYIENVETYIDPTIETKTPTCKANFSKTDITAPGESKLSFSSENTTKLIGSCTGPWPIKELELPLSYTNYPFPFTINQTGTETCTFTPYNGTTKGESCSATVIVKKSTASTPTPTPSPAKPKPADYVTLHDAYTRAPEDKEYYSFTQNITTSHEYIPQFRAFIPPGTNYVNLIIKDYSDQSGSSWGGRKSVSRHILLPEASPEGDMPSEFIIGDYSTLTELIDHECWTEVNQMSALNIADESFSPPFLDIHRAGWLYAKVSSEYSTKYDTHFAVRVDTKTYNAWWDKYIKDEAGWNKYIENVETYIDPTTEIQTSPTPTPTPTQTPTQTPSLTATTSNLDANFTITNGTSCINYMCDTTTKTMVASEKDFKYQESFTCHYTKAGSYTASIECPNNNIITKVVTVKNPTQSSKACQRDNPDCEKSTCNNVYCFDGCERVKGTRVCDGK